MELDNSLELKVFRVGQKIPGQSFSFVLVIARDYSEAGSIAERLPYPISQIVEEGPLWGISSQAVGAILKQHHEDSNAS